MKEPITFTTKIILPKEEVERVQKSLEHMFKPFPIKLDYSVQDVTLKEITVFAGLNTTSAIKELLKLMGIDEADINKLSRIKSYVKVMLENVVRNILQSIGMNRQG